VLFLPTLFAPNPNVRRSARDAVAHRESRRALTTQNKVNVNALKATRTALHWQLSWRTGNDGALIPPEPSGYANNTV